MEKRLEVAAAVCAISLYLHAKLSLGVAWAEGRERKA